PPISTLLPYTTLFRAHLHHSLRVLLPRSLLARQAGALGVLEGEGARHLRFALSLHDAGAAGVGRVFVDALEQTRAAHDGEHRVTPYRRATVDDGDVLHRLQRLQADFHAPLHGADAVRRIALVVLRDHVGLAQHVGELQRLVERLRGQAELRLAGLKR